MPMPKSPGRPRGKMKTTAANAKASRREVAIALLNADGNYAEAARTLGCDPRNLRKRIRADNDLCQLDDDLNSVSLSLAIGNVRKALIDGDLTTSRWLLERKGKHLGYGNSLGVKLSDQDIAEFIGKLTPDQLRALAEGE